MFKYTLIELALTIFSGNRQTVYVLMFYRLFCYAEDVSTFYKSANKTMFSLYKCYINDS